MHRTRLIVAMLMLALAGCEDKQQNDSVKDTVVKSSALVLQQDPVRYTRGLKLYQNNCATCHGRQGEGAPNWQRRDADGKFPPPPLNGSGHTWHHPLPELVDIIKYGTQGRGGNMPPWKDRLTDAQIQDILFWVQSQWSREIYAAWYRNNENAARKRVAPQS